jgi:hypothetical protein
VKIALLGAACWLIPWGLLTARSYYFYRLTGREQHAAGLPVSFPTFASWQDEIWRRTTLEWKKQMGFAPRDGE